MKEILGCRLTKRIRELLADVVAGGTVLRRGIGYTLRVRVLFDRLLDAREPFWRYCFQSFALALFPSLLLSAAAWGVVRVLDSDMTHLEPPKPGASMADLFGAVIFSPVV